MKKPETIEAFTALIKDMDHRERFVFKSSELLKDQNADIDNVEIYATVLYDKATFSNGVDTNIKVSLNDVCGKQIKSSAYCISKYRRLWSPGFYISVYSYIS